MVSWECGNAAATFPDPDKGDIEYVDLRTKIDSSMAGTYKTVIKGPLIHRFRQTFTLLSGLDNTTPVPPSFFIQKVIDFILAHEESVVKFTNYDGQIYNVKFLKPTYDYINNARDRSSLFIETESV